MTNKMRDTRKSFEYFSREMQLRAEDMLYCENKVVLQEDTEKFARKYSFWLTRAYALLFDAYSIGEDIASIRQHVAYTARVFCGWNQTRRYGLIENIDQFFNIAALLILTKLEAETEAVLTSSNQFITEQNVLTVALVGFMTNGVPKTTNGTYLATFEYSLLERAVTATDNAERLQLLQQYLEHFLEVMSGELDWPYSHKLSDDIPIYAGYWAFVVGAIVVMYDLDDTTLRTSPYYPADLVDFYRSDEVA